MRMRDGGGGWGGVRVSEVPLYPASSPSIYIYLHTYKYIRIYMYVCIYTDIYRYKSKDVTYIWYVVHGIS